MKKLISVYIHIPFCAAKCKYCDFNSYDDIGHLQEEYVECLLQELDMYKDVLQQHLVKTVYIGGGTPTYLTDKLLARLLCGVRERMNIDDNAEVSIESNPGTLTKSKLTLLYQSGVNRLSIGVQSLDDDILNCLGRIHTTKQFIDNYSLARKVGFDNINVDLMFSLPGQTLEKWQETIKAVVALAPTHLSCYSLKIEENTPFYRAYEEQRLVLPDDKTDRQMYEILKLMLAQEGYHHYEISNFAKPTFACHHNLVYWQCQPYIGIGAGAHSFVHNQRYVNEMLPRRYIQKTKQNTRSTVEQKQISYHEQMSDFIILGLRLIQGVAYQEFYRKFNLTVGEVFPGKVDRYIKMGLMEKDETHFWLTTRGIDISNQIFIDFL